MKDFKNITDLLPVGKHTLKVSKAKEWDNSSGSFIMGSHKSGTSKTGNKWWMYSTKVGDTWVSLFANSKNKFMFDSGEVVVDIVQKFDSNTGEPVKKYYINEKKKEIKQDDYINKESTSITPSKEELNEVFGDDVSVEDVPF